MLWHLSFFCYYISDGAENAPDVIGYSFSIETTSRYQSAVVNLLNNMRRQCCFYSPRKNDGHIHISKRLAFLPKQCQCYCQYCSLQYIFYYTLSCAAVLYSTYYSLTCSDGSNGNISGDSLFNGAFTLTLTVLTAPAAVVRT